MRRIVNMLGMKVFMALLLSGSAACDYIASEADTKVSSVRCDVDVGVIHGELDAGIMVSFDIVNHGKTGVTRVSASISTSEGEWSRGRDLTLEANRKRRLQFFFHEPTVNATDIQCRARSFP